MLLVLIACSCAAMNKASVVLFKHPFLSHPHRSSLTLPIFCLINCPYNCFCVHFIFLSFFLLFLCVHLVFLNLHLLLCMEHLIISLLLFSHPRNTAKYLTTDTAQVLIALKTFPLFNFFFNKLLLAHLNTYSSPSPSDLITLLFNDWIPSIFPFFITSMAHLSIPNCILNVFGLFSFGIRLEIIHEQSMIYCFSSSKFIPRINCSQHMCYKFQGNHKQ